MGGALVLVEYVAGRKMLYRATGVFDGALSVLRDVVSHRKGLP